MKRWVLTGLVSILALQFSYSQKLFENATPMNVGLKVSIPEVKQDTKDSVYTVESLYYTNKDGNIDSIQIGVKGRGNFRFQECYYPPLKIQIKKKDAKDTPFEDDKKLKLVMPCKNQSGNNELIIKELLCYKLYEAVSDKYFKTQLLNLKYEEVRKKKTVANDFYAFFIQDDEEVAKRLNAKVISNTVFPQVLNDTIAALNDFFEFMIANVDYSLGTQHNAKLFFNTSNMHFPIVYDFDMAGVVNPPYWTVPSRNGQPITSGTATDRLFLGFCRSEQVYGWVRNHFIQKEENVMAVLKAYESYLSDSENKRIRNFLADFFSTIKNDSQYERQILNVCRK